MNEYIPRRATPFDLAAEAAAGPVTPVDRTDRRVFEAAAHEAVQRAQQRQHRRSLVAAAIVTPAVLVFGGGTAYAVAQVDWSSYWSNTTATEWTDWAQSPDAVISYTLPSGRACELRLGQFAFSPAEDRPADVAADPQSLASALDFAHTSLAITDADVQRVIAENRSDRNVIMDTDGTQTPFGHGTDQYDADVEYDMAVPEAVYDAIDAHLAALGLPSTGLTYQGQQQCSDATS